MANKKQMQELLTNDADIKMSMDALNRDVGRAKN